MKEFLKTVIYKPLYNILVFFAWLVPGHSIGWAIIILTILIRLALLPSSLKAAKSQTKLQSIQPKINKIRKEIKDQGEQGRAMMQLYKDEGVSPFGSCLPLLIQLPILWILYRVFNASLDESRYGYIYSFVPHADKINPFFFGLDLSKPEHWVLPIMAGVAQFVLSKMTMPPAPKDAEAANDPMVMMNKQMIYLFPLFTLFIARSLPSALAIYWVVTTLFGIGQQYYVNKLLKKEKANNSGAEEFDVEKYKNLAPVSPVPEIKKPEKKPQSSQSDLLTKAMKKKLDKEEKKSGVEVTIRTKK